MTSLRLVVWTCNQALHAKYGRLLDLQPDLAIVPECAEPEILRKKAPDFAFADCEWRGPLEHKGLGVFAFNGLRLRVHPSWEPRFHIFLPLEVDGSHRLNVLAAWAFNYQVPAEVAAEPTATGQVLEHYAEFLSGGRGVLAGDLNANVIWDASNRYERFAGVDAALRNLGLVSAYHAAGGHVLGKEPHPTLFWQKKVSQGYHIDYAYVPATWTNKLRSVTVGSAEDSLSDSDHAPLIVDFAAGPQ